MYLVLPPVAATATDSHAEEVDQLQEAETRDSHKQAADATAVGNQCRYSEQNRTFNGRKLMLLEVDGETGSNSTERS